ncbi:MAG: inositol monophosphatase [Opitutae bacterium]|jgi:fructose-1,6-bisphosphatase/inositol monophosphatase family enzyme|nr:inositol monophosphatase [Opitutae bacterium]MBT7924422.1 inositol monophosphatase [Opitutae bacterium]
MNLKALTKQAVQAAVEAGELIRSYQDSEVEVLHKEGGDTYASQVVTETDRKAQDVILHILGPSCEEFDLAVLTEENEDDGSRFEKKFFWCIDPMDGTLPFIRKEPGYSVSIALVARDGSPQIGVVYDPVYDVLWQATKGQGVRRNGEPWTLDASSKELTFTYDRSFTDRPERDRVLQELADYAQSLGLKKLVAAQFGGAVINACHALEAAPGCHFKFAKPQEGGGSLWDYAATACLFEEAGAVVSDVHGELLDLNRSDSTFMNHRGAVYATDQDLAERIRKILSSFE